MFFQNFSYFKIHRFSPTPTFFPDRATLKIQENSLIFGDFGNLGLVGEVTHSSFYTGLESDQGVGGAIAFFQNPSILPHGLQNLGVIIGVLGASPSPLWVRLAYEWQYNIGSVLTIPTSAHLSLCDN